MDEFSAQGLANIGWAFAMAGAHQSRARLFAVLATATERRMVDFKA